MQKTCCWLDITIFSCGKGLKNGIQREEGGGGGGERDWCLHKLIPTWEKDQISHVCTCKCRQSMNHTRGSLRTCGRTRKPGKCPDMPTTTGASAERDRDRDRQKDWQTDRQTHCEREGETERKIGIRRLWDRKRKRQSDYIAVFEGIGKHHYTMECCYFQTD